MKMLPAEHGSVTLAIELEEFQIRIYLMRLLVIIHVVFYVPTVLAPGGEKFNDFYRVCVLNCIHYVISV